MLRVSYVVTCVLLLMLYWIYWSPDHVNNNRHILYGIDLVRQLYWWCLSTSMWFAEYLSSLFSCSILSIFIHQRHNYFQLLYMKLSHNIETTTKFKKKKSYCLVITVCVWNIDWIDYYVNDFDRFVDEVYEHSSVCSGEGKAGDKRFLFPNPKGISNDIFDLKNRIKYVFYIQRQFLWYESRVKYCLLL